MNSNCNILECVSQKGEFSKSGNLIILGAKEAVFERLGCYIADMQELINFMSRITSYVVDLQFSSLIWRPFSDLESAILQTYKIDLYMAETPPPILQLYNIAQYRPDA